MFKNQSGQQWRVFAYDPTTGLPVTGDAAQITAKIKKDFGTAAATGTANPTEDEDGYYDFPLTQEETNADDLHIMPESSTANVVVVGVPGYHPTRLTAAEHAQAVEQAIINDGDATATLQAIDDKIAAGIEAGDLSAIAMADATITKLLPYLRLLARSDASEPTELAALNDSGGAYVPGSHSLQANAEAATGGGSGANTVSITVQDDDTGDPLQNANVRLMAAGMPDAVATTNASGVAELRVDDATWTIAATAQSGYSSGVGSIVVPTSLAETVELTAHAAASPVGQVTGRSIVYDEFGVVENAVTITCSWDSASDSGIIADKKTRTSDSGVDGVVTFTGLFPGHTYNFYRGKAHEGKQVTIPADATDPYDLPTFGGKE